MQNYKDLKVWNKAHRFSLEVYEVSLQFPKEEIYGLTSQLRRSVVSIPANIAEDCGRNSNAELGHFLNIALGSANESEYFLILSKDLGYLPELVYAGLSVNINEVKAMLLSLISKVRQGLT